MKSILTFLFLVLAQVLLAQNTNFLDKKQIDCQEIKACCQDRHNFCGSVQIKVCAGLTVRSLLPIITMMPILLRWRVIMSWLC